jgi:MFS family permease
MNAVSSPRAAASLRLFVLICGLPMTDFIQTGVVAFNAAPIMGDIGASPEEYSLVATLYAVVAVAMLFNHRWLLERFGWRNAMVASYVLFAVGAVGCAVCESLTQFAVSRVMMAMGTASFFTASRVLVNHIPPSPRRFVAIRFLASGIAWGAVLGPLVASIAYSHGSWRYAFFALLVPVSVLCALSLSVLPAGRMAASSRPRPLPLLVFVTGSLVLLYGLQRSNFAFYAEPGSLALLGIFALAVVGLAIWLTLRHEKPVLGFGALAQTRYLLGLAIFLVCYLVLGANNTMLPLLLRGLQLPLETVDRTIAGGALGGVLAWIVLARLLPRYPGITRYYLAAFSLLGLCGLQLSRLSESAHPIRDIVPGLLANGAFIICALSTTAMQTFQTLQYDEAVFSHANQVKNMLSQIGTAMGMTIATLCVQWRGAFHQTRLVEAVSPTNPALQQTLGTLVPFFTSTVDPATAPSLSLAQVGTMLAQEATLLATLDYFWALTRFALVILAIVLLERALRQWRASVTALVQVATARG